MDEEQRRLLEELLRARGDSTVVTDFERQLDLFESSQEVNAELEQAALQDPTNPFAQATEQTREVNEIGALPWWSNLPVVGPLAGVMLLEEKLRAERGSDLPVIGPLLGFKLLDETLGDNATVVDAVFTGLAASGGILGDVGGVLQNAFSGRLRGRSKDIQFSLVTEATEGARLRHAAENPDITLNPESRAQRRADEVRTPEQHEVSALGILQQQAFQRRVPLSPAVREVEEAMVRGDTPGVIRAYLKNPGALTAFFLTESSSQSPSALMAAFVPMVGALVGSFKAEQRARIFEGLSGAMKNPNDVDELAEILGDEKKLGGIFEKANKGAGAASLTELFINVFSLGMARGISSPVLRVLVEMGSEVAGESFGEAAAQLVTEGKVNVASALGEGLSQFSTSAVTVGGTELGRFVNEAPLIEAQQNAFTESLSDQVIELMLKEDSLPTATEKALKNEQTRREDLADEQLLHPDSANQLPTPLPTTEEGQQDAQTRNEEEAPRQPASTEETQGISQEEERRQALDGKLRRRQFGEQVLASEAVTQEIKVATDQLFNYTPITNKQTRSEMRAVIDRLGVVEAKQHVLDFNNELVPRVRVTLGEQLILEFSRLSEQAEDPVASLAFTRESITLIREFAEYGTQLGQGVQAYSLFRYLSPEGHVVAFEDLLAESVLRRKDREVATIRDVTEGIRLGATAAFEGILQRHGPLLEGLSDSSRQMMQGALEQKDTRGVEQALVESGLAEDQAQEQAKRLQEEYTEAASERVKSILKQRFKGLALSGIGRAVPTDLIEHITNKVTESGDFSERSINEAIEDFYKAPQATAEQQKHIVELARKMLRAPEGSFLQADHGKNLQSYMTRQVGVDLTDLLESYWYANVLSGAGTQEINAFGNASNLFLHAMQTTMASPGTTGALFHGMAQGARVGLAEAAAAMRGQAVLKGVEGKYQTNRGLEVLYDPKARGLWANTKNVMSVGRYVFRGLQAVDAFFYRTAYEGRAHVLAVRQAKEVGLKGERFENYVANELFSSDAHFVAARAQAEADVKVEGRSRRGDILRRTFEILDDQRRLVIREDAQSFAEKVTYVNKPSGSMGKLANAANYIVENVSIDTRLGRVRPIKLIIPFVNIVANVSSRKVDFIPPIGLARAMRGGRIFGKNEGLTSLEYREQLAAAMIGTVAMGMMYALFASYEDDDDPYWAITFSGPRDYYHRNQLRSTGWEPGTIKIGETYWKYNELPLGLLLGVLGAYMDAKKYGKVGEKALGDRLGFALNVMPNMFIEDSFLSGVGNFFDVVAERRSASSLFTSPASGLVPFSGALRDVANFTDPTLRDRESAGVIGGLFRDVPVMRSAIGRPMLNVLGQPIRREGVAKTPLRRFGSSRTDDPVWLFLAKNKIFIPDARRGPITVMIPNATKKERRQGNRLAESRERRLGRLAFGVMTQEEAYDFVEIRGKMIEKDIRRNLRRMERMDPGEERQEFVEDIVRKRNKDAKLVMLNLLRKKEREGLVEQLRDHE